MVWIFSQQASTELNGCKIIAYCIWNVLQISYCNMLKTLQKACKVMYSLVVTLENSQCVYYAILVIWLSPIYTNQKSMGFHLKGGSALISQIFSCFNWEIGKFLQIFCFSTVPTKFA
jgi:hypothetical protein